MFRLFISCFLVFSQLSLNGQDVVDSAAGKTVFWKISGNGLESPSYLFGTAHPILRNDIFIPDTILQIIAQTEAIYFESLPSTEFDSMRYLMDKPELPKLLGKVNYNLTVKTLERFEHPVLKEPSFHNMSPAFIQRIILNCFFGNEITTLDDSLMSIAFSKHKQVFPLDTREIKKQLSERISYDQQATALYNLLNNLDNNIQYVIRNLKTWATMYYSGNIEAMYLKNSYIGLSTGIGGRTFYVGNPNTELTLDKRNKMWAPIMEEAMNFQKCFFAFGAAHLAGKFGVINLLRNKGYILTPILITYKKT